MNLPVASYTVIYNNKDITKDISDMVMSLEYTDKITGQTDEISITVEDRDERWLNEWYPQKGDSIQVVIFSEDGKLNCGSFTIDEIEAIAAPDNGYVFNFKGVAAPVNKALRTVRSYAHEDKTLREIANTVAANLGLTLIGSIENITIHRVNQYRETDLAFLNRIGGAYGYIFSVRGNNLVFVYYKDIETREASLQITRQNLLDYSFKDTTNKVYKSSSVKHHDPKTKQNISFEESSEDDDDDNSSSDDLNLYDRVENKQQAEAKAKYALHNKNTRGVTCELQLPGNILFVSGNNFQITDTGKFNGKYHIEEAHHSITRDGSYVSSGSAKRLST